MLLGLEPVGTKEFETTLGLSLGQTLLSALEKGEDIVDDYGFEVNLVLVVEILSLELDLKMLSECECLIRMQVCSPGPCRLWRLHVTGK